MGLCRPAWRDALPTGDAFLTGAGGTVPPVVEEDDNAEAGTLGIIVFMTG